MTDVKKAGDLTACMGNARVGTSMCDRRVVEYVTTDAHGDIVWPLCKLHHTLFGKKYGPLKTIRPSQMVLYHTPNVYRVAVWRLSR